MPNGAGIGNLLLLVLPLLLIVWLFVTQRRRQRQTQDLQSSLAVGDEVCTTSGLFATITALDDHVATLQVGPGMTVRWDRRAIGLKGGPGATTTSNTPQNPQAPTGPTGSGE